MRHAGDEALREPLVRAVVAAAVVGAVGVVVGLDWQVALVTAVVTGVVIREVSAGVQAASRRAASVQAHQTLLGLLGSGSMPPMFDGWAIAPDFGLLILERLARRPEVVVECGSGVSTLLIASGLRANETGRLYSLEHDPLIAEETRSRLDERGLGDWAEVISAPLAPQTFETDEVMWYEPSGAAGVPAAIDLLVVDGPPPVVPLARWPALDVFYSRLAPEACVLLDDGRRRSERRVALRWDRSYGDFDLYWIDTLKGTWMLLRTPEAAPRSAAVSAVRRVRRAVHPRPPGFDHWPVLR